MAKKAQLPKDAGKPKAAQAAPAKKNNSALLLLVVVAAVALVAAGVIILQAQAARKPVALSGRVGEGAAWGPVDAPVQIVDYSDYLCVHCANFALDQGRRLREEFEATGKVRFEFKNFLINGQPAAAAANAAECAADQGRFWDYHDILFSQQGLSANAYTKDALKGYAVQMGLDTTQFDQCVDNDLHLEKVYRDTSEGQGKGVSATPTFFVNGEKIQGAVAYEQFKSAVEAALASAN